MIVLHHCPETRSMRTLWLLHELGVEFDVVTHSFDKALRQPDYLKLSPAGRVPSIEFDGMTLFETGAIAEYLCERFPDVGLGRLPGQPERAEWLVWLHFAETISQHTAALTQQHVALYDDSMRSPVVMKLEAARLKKCYAALEERLAGRDHLLDGGFSATDIGNAQALYMSKHFAAIDEYPAVERWYARVTARPGFIASLPGPDEARLYGKDFYPAWEVAR